MTDATNVVQKIQAVIDDLDPRTQDVAIAHLSDAIEAVQATSRDRPTRYTRDGDIVDGKVMRKGALKLFK